MIKSNFKNGLINLSATLADFVGDKNEIIKLDWLKEKLNNAPKNVIFIIFDGLGIYNINNLTKKNDYYKRHIKSVISSTMPATTTNATTTLSSTKHTDEHLWVAWSLWLKDYQKVMEIYLGTNYYTGEKIGKYEVSYENFFDRADNKRKITTIAPVYAHYSNKIESLTANSVDELFNHLNNCLKRNNKQFLYCYCDEPDHTMHEYGVKSKEVNEVFEKIQSKLEEFIQNNKDILVITTADHGHIDVKKYIHINDDKEIMAMQERQISMESRFVSFKIKKGIKKEFKSLFEKRYGKYFDLLSQNELLKLKIFGNGNNKELMKEYIGDFIAIGNRTFYAINFRDKKEGLLKGAHAGGSKEEMEVPLCIFEN